MPPKAANVTLNEKDAVFLINCIRNGKEKLMPDYNRVAQDTGMSKGGAENKFRALMKRFEAEGSSWAQPSAGESTAIEKPTTKRARPAAKKKNATSEPEPESGEDEAEEAERPKKKAATNGTKAKVGAKKGVAKKMTAAKSGETIEEDADDQEEAE